MDRLRVRAEERRRRQDHWGQIWVLSRQGGEARRLTTRKGGAGDFQWSPDSTRLVFVGDDPDPEEDKTGDDKPPKKPIVIDRYGFKRDAREGRVAVVSTTGTTAPEVHGVAAAGAPDGVRGLSAISHQNDAWLAGLQLGAVEDFDFTSPDGTKVGAILVKPVGYEAGRRYPLVLYIHGGPNSQDQHELDIESQLLAAKGYAVLNVNYRGSAGRGADVPDGDLRRLGQQRSGRPAGRRGLGGREGIADPARLGIGGWSYGGILDQLHDRQRPALQGRGERRRQLAAAHDVRHRPVHRPVQPRDGPALEEPGRVDEGVLPVLQGRPDQDADDVHGAKDFNVPAPAASRCTRRCGPRASRRSS